jgi:hypothetical protein
MKKEEIRDYFARYPKSNECYEAGGKLFHTAGAAMSFGTARKWTRKEAESETSPDNINAADFPVVDLSALKQQELKKYADKFGIETADSKKETLLAALLEYQKQLNDGKDENENDDDE